MKKTHLFLAMAAMLMVAGSFTSAEVPLEFHSADTNQNYRFELAELLRAVQIFNMGGYYPCPDEGTEDGFCPGPRPIETQDLFPSGFIFVEESLVNPATDHFVAEITAAEVPLSPFAVRFLIDGEVVANREAQPDSQSWLIGARFADDYFSAGSHTATLIVDPENLIAEGNEDNNVIQLTFVVPQPNVVMPDLSGMSMPQARLAAEAVGLVFGGGDLVCSDSPIGQVFAQNPMAGSSLPLGSTITINISSGPCYGEGEGEEGEGQTEGEPEGNVEGEGEGTIEGEGQIEPLIGIDVLEVWIGGAMRGSTNVVNDVKIAVYIHVPGYGWVLKPATMTESCFSVNPDGNWTVWPFQSAGDVLADEVLVILLPTSVEPPACYPDPCQDRPNIVSSLVDVELVINKK